MRMKNRMKLFCVVLDRLEWIEWNRIGFNKNDSWWEMWLSLFSLLIKLILYKHVNLEFLTTDSFNKLSIMLELACNIFTTFYLRYL